MPSTDSLFPKANSDNISRTGYSSLGREDSFPADGSQLSSSRNSGFFRRFFSTRGAPQILLVSLLTTLSYGLIVAILPKVSTQRFANLKYGYKGEDCNAIETYQEKPEACLLASADAQNAHAFSELIANLLTFLSGSMVGAISDSQGRRGFMMVATTAIMMGNFAFGVVYFRPGTDPWFFYYVRALHGAINWIAVALASLADVMPPELRAASVGILMGGYWLGVCVGPAIAVVLGSTNAVICSCGVAMAAIFCAVFLVPETLPTAVAQEARRQRAEMNGDRTGLGLLYWNLSRPARELSIVCRDGFFRLLSILAFCNGMVTSGDKILLLYYVESKLSFTLQDTALMLLLFGVGTVAAQTLILKPLNDCIGERLIVVVCFVAAVFSNAIYGLANSRGTLFLGIPIASLAGMAFPTFSAIKANNVDELEQGRVQGALYSILALASGVGPILMRLVDSLAADGFLGPGAMFLFAAFLQLIAAYFSCQLPPERSNSRSIVKMRNEMSCREKSEEMAVL